MKNKLYDLLKQQQHEKISVNYGKKVHTRLQYADDNIVQDLLKKVPELSRMFDSLTRPEVPIAGYINGCFISRRIDRLRIDSAEKSIDVLDFKTDLDKNIHRKHHLKQLNEYKQLLLNCYPEYKVRCFVLWVHDWTYERLV